MSMMKDTLHLKAPGNWINDPNGFIYYRGEYHLFYQHFPYAPRWGTMHWGHAVSRDLVHWEHQGVALFPTKSYDQNGVFSGSAMEVDGKLHLYFSAVRYLAANPEDIHCADGDAFVTSQAMIVSPDGKTFDNFGQKRQIIPVLEDAAIGDAKDTRDPKVWKTKDGYAMILGSTGPDQTGRALIFHSTDGEHWSYQNQYRSPAFGKMLECPDLFEVDGQWVLVGSPMGARRTGVQYYDQAKCAPAAFEEETGTLSLQGDFRILDDGLDFYAPQTTLDEEGRRVMIAWMRMPRPVETSADGRGAWNGMMTLPRVLHWKDGWLYTSVHPAVDALFTKPVAPQDVAFDKPFRLKAKLSEGDALNVCGYRIRMENGCIAGDRSDVFDGIEGYSLTAKTPAVEGTTAALDIFVDSHVIEIYIDGGRHVLSHVIYGAKPVLEGAFDSAWTMDGEV